MKDDNKELVVELDEEGLKVKDIENMLINDIKRMFEELNVQSLPEGGYILRLINEKENKSFKFLKI